MGFDNKYLNNARKIARNVVLPVREILARESLGGAFKGVLAREREREVACGA